VARLRIRIELSRGGLGVPLHKVASVISKSQKFLDLLGEDVHIDRTKGEWLGFDFDRESLNFTAEYVGAVTAEQVEAFNAAFDGTTSLRRDTIAQFAGITEAIGEDEIIGFGLYQTDETDEPTEWRCLSRRDALRIAEGIQLLLGADQETHLPAVRDPSLGARIFGERREWSGSDSVREVEKSLTHRLQRVEHQVERHSELLEDLQSHTATTETSFRNLLSTVESFCNQATTRIEKASPAALPPAPEPAEARTESVGEHPSKPSRRWLVLAAVLAIGAGIAAVSAWLWSAHPAAAFTKKEPVVASVAPPPVEQAAQPAPAATAGTRIELDAKEEAWVSLIDQENNKLLFNELLVPGVSRTFEVAKGASVRTGNAGGLLLHVNGRSFGPFGPSGQVRQIQIKDGSALVSPQ
jgi:hypothetical protein